MTRPILLFILFLSACAPPSDNAANNVAAPAVPAPTAVSIERSSPTLDFAYAWPVEAAAIPALDAHLRADLDKAFREERKNATEDFTLSRSDGREPLRHEFSLGWESAGQSPRLLSLVGAIYSFSGGAHPNHGSESLLWDRSSGQPVKASDLFAALSDLDRLTRAAWCTGIDSERAKRREGEALGGQFDQCPALADLAIVAADKDKNGRFDTLDFLADPYVAGPYVEGDYEVALPVSAAIIAAIKPDYRASFEVQRRQ